MTELLDGFVVRSPFDCTRFPVRVQHTERFVMSHRRALTVSIERFRSGMTLLLNRSRVESKKKFRSWIKFWRLMRAGEKFLPKSPQHFDFNLFRPLPSDQIFFTNTTTHPAPLLGIFSLDSADDSPNSAW